MQFKGTKENWVNVIIDIADFKQVVVGVNKGKAICHLWFEYSEGITDEIKANALLISKAPEMLEMLKDLLASWETGNFESEQFVYVKQLIKEATEL
jgi:hypothetical protein